LHPKTLRFPKAKTLYTTMLSNQGIAIERDFHPNSKD
jgi:hypothetical protein